MSTPKEWANAQQQEMQAVATQCTYLRNPLPAGEGICAVCRSSVGPNYELCYPCNRHRQLSGGHLADVVAPIAYSIKGTQHAYNLIIYKADPPSVPAQYNLSALGVMYLAYHWDCLAQALGGPFTHLTTVPSTRGRQGPHPIESIIARRINLPPLQPLVNPAYLPDDRGFHQDRFVLLPGTASGARVLLVDDTWTTGARIQSLAYALKAAGAVGVAAVVLGRHVDPGYGPSTAMLDRLRAAPRFDLSRCVLDTAG